MENMLKIWMIISLVSCLSYSCNKQHDKLQETQQSKYTDQSSHSENQMSAWYSLKNPSAGFEILLPTEPRKKEKREITDSGLVTTTAYLSIMNKAAYSVVVTNMPLAIATGIDPDKEFEDSVEKLKKKISGKVVKQKSQNIDGNKSRIFTMIGDGPNGQTIYRVKIIRVGQNTIQLMTAHPQKMDFANDAKSFFDSFKLLKTN